MKVIIAGSRTIHNIALVESALFKAVQRWRNKGVSHYITEVVCGEAPGVDRLGKKIAQKANIPVKSFPAEWDKYGKKAGYIRNLSMADYADALIAIWDGQSPGTRMMIELAKKKKLKIFVYKIEKIGI